MEMIDILNSSIVGLLFFKPKQFLNYDRMVNFNYNKLV